MEEDGRPGICSKRLQVLPLAMRLSLLHSTRPSPALGQPFLTFGDLAAHTKTCKTLFFFFSLLHTSIPASRSLRSSSPTLSLPLVALKKQPYRCTCRANTPPPRYTPAHCAGPSEAPGSLKGLPLLWLTPTLKDDVTISLVVRALFSKAAIVLIHHFHLCFLSFHLTSSISAFSSSTTISVKF